MTTWFPVIFVIILLQSTFGYINSTCSSNTLNQCILQRNTCHLNYSTNPIQCDDGISIGCEAQTMQSTCSSNGCFWDPYIVSCFNTSSIAYSLYSCSTWDPTLYGSSTTPCLYHSCMINQEDYSCVSSLSSIGVVSLNHTTTFVSPLIPSDSTNITGTIIIPINMQIASATQYIFQIGTTSMNETSAWSYPNGCNSLLKKIAHLQTSVVPVNFTGDLNVLKQTLIDWVQIHHNFDFNVSTLLGKVLSSYYGNIAIGQDRSWLTYADISFDQSSLILTYSFDMNHAYEQCKAYDVKYTNQMDFVHWTIPLSVVQINSLGTWSDISTSFSITFSTTGSVVVSDGLSYVPSTEIKESLFIQGLCPIGQMQMQNTFDVIYNNVYDITRVVGPRYVSDILLRTEQSGLLNCYGDVVKSVGLTTCNSQTHSCITPVVLLSRCRRLLSNGNAFQSCTYAEPSDIEIDLGFENSTYPINLDQTHTFFSKTYDCPVNRTNDLDCIIVSNSSSSYDMFTSIVRLNIYPTTFTNISYPSVEFGLLNSANDYVLNIITENSLSFQTQTYENLNVVIRLKDAIHRSKYDLYLLPQSFNLTLRDVSKNHSIMNSLMFQWKDVMPYVTALPKNLACVNCYQLPICQGVRGCDGFSIPDYLLNRLVPNANTFELNIAYYIVTSYDTEYTTNITYITQSISINPWSNNVSCLQFDMLYIVISIIFLYLV